MANRASAIHRPEYCRPPLRGALLPLDTLERVDPAQIASLARFLYLHPNRPLLHTGGVSIESCGALGSPIAFFSILRLRLRPSILALRFTDT